MKPEILSLLPNRVRRNYRGGAGIDRFEGKSNCRDSDQPEDWVGSLTTARNPGLPPVENEGLATVVENGNTAMLCDVIKNAPEYYFGKPQVESGFLMKILDSSMRLHVQAHPTREFARKHLNSEWGKLEAYYILDVRENCDPYIRLGFQHPPEPEEWKRIVLEQNITAMDACFEKVPVKPGETWYVPGGLPHAIGEGLTVIEVMEPSDLVVRCEFEREEIVVPPPARFMGRDPDFALRIFDFTPWSVDAVTSKFRVAPQLIYENENLRETRLLGTPQVDCFELKKLTFTGPAQLPLDERFAIALTLSGSGSIKTTAQTYQIKKSSRFLIPAATTDIEVIPDKNNCLEIFLCLPA